MVMSAALRAAPVNTQFTSSPASDKMNAQVSMRLLGDRVEPGALSTALATSARGIRTRAGLVTQLHYA
jgi:hypothetical protein